MMKFIKEKGRRLFFLIYAFMMPAIVLAEVTIVPCEPSGKICNPLGDNVNTLPDLIKKIVEGVLLIGIPIIALAVVYSGFLFVFARGNPEKLNTAKETLTVTLIGASVLLGSWAIANIISTTITSIGS